MPQMPDSFNHDLKAASNRRSGKDADHILGEKQLVLILEIIFICFMMSIKLSFKLTPNLPLATVSFCPNSQQLNRSTCLKCGILSAFYGMEILLFETVNFTENIEFVLHKSCRFKHLAT